MTRAYDASKLLGVAESLLRFLESDDASVTPELRTKLSAAIADCQGELSHLERDGVPTLYVSEDGSTSTHRMQSSDIRVWCATAEDGHRLMTVIDLLGERKHHFGRPMFRTGGAQ